MSDQDSSSSEAAPEGEPEGDIDDRTGAQQDSAPLSLSSFSSSLRAVIRIKQKYEAMKRRRQEMMGVALGGAYGFKGAPVRTSPKIFTFDGIAAHAQPALQKKKRRRRRRVLFPNRGRRSTMPRQEGSRAQYCLYLLLAIVCVQVYNAIENLDDHVLRYDIEGLERTLQREVFGQQGAVDALLHHLKEYLSTYVHNKPLLLSLHGATGVGKSHLGRLLAAHFRSVVGEDLVLQYYALHHCPLQAHAHQCAADLFGLVSTKLQQAEEEEKIPLFVFDEAEHIHSEILDMLQLLVSARRPNEHLNAIYLFLSNLGHAHITKHILHNSSSVSMAMTAAGRHISLAKALTPKLRATLEELHPLWSEAAILALGLLEKGHVMQCFLDEMSREGFYPDHTNMERLAEELEYYPMVGGRQFARSGCKMVVAKVNLL